VARSASWGRGRPNEWRPAQACVILPTERRPNGRARRGRGERVLKYSYSVTRSFSSTHHSNQPSRCAHVHGHNFTATATASHPDLDGSGIPRGTEDLEGAWDGIVLELDNRALDKMVPGLQSLPSLAAYLFERISGHFAGLSKVEVSDGCGASGIVER
jgi:6-pyruvoyl-tetrahydropterin synthase